MFSFSGHLRNEDFLEKESTTPCRRVNAKVSPVDRINCSKHGHILYIETHHGNTTHVTLTSWQVFQGLYKEKQLISYLPPT